MTRGRQIFPRSRIRRIPRLRLRRFPFAHRNWQSIPSAISTKRAPKICRIRFRRHFGRSFPVTGAKGQTKVVYYVSTRIVTATQLPESNVSSTATYSDRYLATVTAQIANNPGNVPLQFDTVTQLFQTPVPTGSDGYNVHGPGGEERLASEAHENLSPHNILPGAHSISLQDLSPIGFYPRRIARFDVDHQPAPHRASADDQLDLRALDAHDGQDRSNSRSGARRLRIDDAQPEPGDAEHLLGLRQSQFADEVYAPIGAALHLRPNDQRDESPGDRVSWHRWLMAGHGCILLCAARIGYAAPEFLQSGSRRVA